MRAKLTQRNHWLLPAVLILFILEVLMFPSVVGLTWSDRSSTPDHVLTYEKNHLYWDSATNILSDGTAELHLFDAVYDQTVKSEDGASVVAPGTEGWHYVRLKNDVRGEVKYTAVLYQIRTSQDLILHPSLIVAGATDTSDVYLPSGVQAAEVIRAVTGYVDGGQFVDLDVKWNWQFEDIQNLEAQDQIDTALGNQEKLDEVTLGLYIVVEDSNSYDRPVVRPEPPATGDGSHVGMYLALLGVSGMILLLLLWDRRREHRNEIY